MRSPAEFESYLSREAAFLFNNLVLVGIAFAVFWGTIFPVLSEAVRGVKITVGPPVLQPGQRTARARADLPDGRWAADRVAAHLAAEPDAKLCRSPITMGVAQRATRFRLGLRAWYVLTALSLAAFVLGTVVGRVPSRRERAAPSGA